MKQALLSLRTGTVELIDIPVPSARPGHVVIRTHCSLVSAGTERMLVDFGRGGLLDKARSQPEKVKQVFEKVFKDGLFPTLEAVQAKLDHPVPLGYCNAGVVIAVGAGISDLAIGDRVASNGAHAEVVSVARNLVTKIPTRADGSEVSFADASFTVLGAIALQGVRLANPTLGERFVVTGMGLVGLLTAQILRANGCHVLGIDFSEQRLDLAKKLGIDTYRASEGGDAATFAREWSKGAGVDAVLIAASTDSNQPMTDAAAMCRRRGRIVLLGVAGLELQRAPYFEKELTFTVSCSYGPGRYDPTYEEKGQDYPLGHVRWTEGRNFEAVLDLIAASRIDVAALVTDRVPFDQAGRAWELISAPQSLGIVLEYPTNEPATQRVIQIAPEPVRASNGPRVAAIGAGNYAMRVLLPALREVGVPPVMVATPGGLSASLTARALGAAEATTDTDAALTSDRVDTVVIATRHDTHADLVCRALEAGKHVFVEKPLCVTRGELERIREVHRRSGRILAVGFNRRFAPHVVHAEKLLREVAGPRTVIITVNAGAIPSTHWTQDASVGAGRIVGEACHWIDLARYLTGSPIVATRGSALGGHADTMSFTHEHEDGSISTIVYVSTGHGRFPKERIEVFAGGRIVAIDNYRRLHAYGWPLRAGAISLKSDKGPVPMMRAFVEAIRNGGPAPVPFDEVANVMTATFDAANVVD